MGVGGESGPDVCIAAIRSVRITIADAARPMCQMGQITAIIVSILTGYGGKGLDLLAGGRRAAPGVGGEMSEESLNRFATGWAAPAVRRG